MGVGSSDTLRLFLLAFDVFITSVAIFLLLLIINSTKGFRYLGILFISLILLVGSAYFTLPGLHLFAQSSLVILLVALPILFHQEWIASLDGSGQAPKAEKFIGWPGLVIIAVVLAGFITLLGAGVTTKTGRLPQEIVVEAVNLPEGLTANLGANSKVKLVISAPRDKWSSITSDSFSATVDVAQQKEGTYDLPVNITSKVVDVIIRRVEPARMVVNVEPVIAKTVPVVAKYAGKAGNDLVPDVPIFTPDKVEVTGPKSVITGMTQAIAIVNIEGQTVKIEQKFTLIGQTVSGEVIDNISFNPIEVAGVINLIKSGKLKSVGVRPVVTGQPAAGLWVDQIIVTPAVVTITGAVDLLDKTTQITTEPIDISSLNAETTKQVNLSFPSGITSADDTKNVKVKITLTDTISTKTTAPTINYVDLNGALKVTSLNPANISILVAGSTTKLSSVDGKVQLNLNLASYKSAGTYAITISKDMIVLPEGVSLVSFLPSAIDVILDNK